MSRSRDDSDQLLAIGALSDRTGVSISAIRFYEGRALLTSERASSGHRRFRKSVIRRLSFILISQRLGYSLDEIKAQLDRLPDQRTPTERDWNRLANQFAIDIDQRIAGLQLLRSKLGDCIGCGCLSLEKCEMWNPGDAASDLGNGPRYLLGDSADDVRVGVRRR